MSVSTIAPGQTIVRTLDIGRCELALADGLDGLLSRLSNLDVHLSLNDEGGLEVDAPEGVLTDELCGILSAAKPDLVRHLVSDKGINHENITDSTPTTAFTVAASDTNSAHTCPSLTPVSIYTTYINRTSYTPTGVSGAFSEGETEEDAQETADYNTRIQALYLAAVAGSLPVESVPLSQGHTATDPNRWVLRTVERLGAIQSQHPHREYLARTIADRDGLDTLARWWVERSVTVSDSLHNSGPDEPP